MSSLVHHNRSNHRDRFEAGRRVHHVADDSLAVLRIGGLNDRFPGRDGDPGSQSELVDLIELLDRLNDAKSSLDRSFGIVLVGGGRAEHGEHTVPHELFDPASEALDVLAHRGVEHREPFAHILGVRAFGVCGEAGEVAEQHRDDPPFL